MTQKHSDAPQLAQGIHCVMVSESVRAVPKRPRDTLRVAILLCVVVMFVEGIFGVIANSLAVLSDAVHMLADVFALSISLFALHASSWGATTRSTFGFRRAEVIGAFCSVLTTWALAVWIIAGAISRSITVIQCASSVEHVICEGVDGKVMLGVGIFGLGMNVVLALVLGLGGTHGHSHGSLSGCASGHSHDEHDHQYGHNYHHRELMSEMETQGLFSDIIEPDVRTEPVNSSGGHDHHMCQGKSGSMNMRAAMLHVIGDCLQSLGVVVAAGVIFMGNTLTYGSSTSTRSYYNLADPFLSVLFGVITVYTTSNLIREVLSNLLEEVPASVDYTVVHDALASVENVQGVEDLHIWSVGPDFVVLSAHLRVDESLRMDQGRAIVMDATQTCKNIGIMHTTIQLNCMSRATDVVVRWR